MTAQDFQQVFECYTSLPLGQHVQIGARLMCLQPILKAIDEHIPVTSGRLLDLGCGYGLVSLILAYRRKQPILGIEASLSRLAIAQQATYGHQHLTFQHGNLAEMSIPMSDAILLIDVLYLFPDDVQRRILTECADRLDSAGTVLIKDNTTLPRWKYRYASFEERLKLMFKAYGVATPARPNYRTPHSWRRLITEANFKIRGEFFSKSAAPYPGIIYICQKQMSK